MLCRKELSVSHYLAQVCDEIGQSFGPQPDVGTVRTDIYPIHEQLDDAGLLRGEQLIPQGSRRSKASRTSSSEISSSFTLAARHVLTTISGARSKLRRWSITAASISAAGMRR